MPALRKSVKGKLISSPTKSSSKLSLLALEFDQLLSRSCTGTMVSPLSFITVVPFFNHLSFFYVMAFIFTAHLIGLPFFFFVILLGNLYEYYLEHGFGKYFQKISPYFEKFIPIINGFISREKVMDHEKMAVSIVFDSLNNREEVIEQVHQFVQLQINSSDFDGAPSVSEELLFQRSSSQNDLVTCCEKQVRMTSASPLILSFPGKPVDVVRTILKTFASLRIEPKEVNEKKSNENESNQTNDFITMVSDKTISFLNIFFNLLPLTEESKKRLVEMIDLMEIPKLIQMTIDAVKKLMKIIQSASIIVNMMVEKFLIWNRSKSFIFQSSFCNPRRGSEPFDLTRGFCDPLPRELVDLLKEKTNKDSEVLVLSILSGALSSYLRLMRGETVESVDINYGKWNDTKVQIKLPLKSSSNDELVFLDYVSNLDSRSKDSSECLERNLSLVKDSLPTNWYQNLILPLTENDTPGLEVQNLYLNSDSSSMINPLVKSLYLWNEVESSKVSKLRILVIHREEGITVTLSGIKNDPIESASLLAECIVKSVASLCYNLNIKWDRRSPPSTPISDA